MSDNYLRMDSHFELQTSPTQLVTRMKTRTKVFYALLAVLSLATWIVSFLVEFNFLLFFYGVIGFGLIAFKYVRLRKAVQKTNE
jgi:hypothetical protein